MARYTEKKAAKVIEKIINNVPIYSNNKIGFISFPFIDNNGNLCACDSFRIIRLFNGIPADTKELYRESITNWKTDDIQKQKTLVSNTIEKALTEDYTITEKPTTEYIKTNKAGNKVNLPGNNVPHFFNDKYLLDMLTLFPSGNWYIKHNDIYSPLLVLDDNGQALVLPCRPD